MGWQPLPEDAKLDHEQDAAPQTAPGPGATFSPLPADAEVEPEPSQAPPETPDYMVDYGLDRPDPNDQPIVITAKRGPKDVTPSETAEGFADVTPTGGYHTDLSKSDVEDWKKLFADKKKPPTAKQLEDFIFERTGMHMTNAGDYLKAVQQTGTINTAINRIIPTKPTTAESAGAQHLASGILANFGPEVAAAAAALGGGDENTVSWNPLDPNSPRYWQAWGMNADQIRAQLERGMMEHPGASMAGEVGGNVLGGIATGELGEAGLARLGPTLQFAGRHVGLPMLEGGAIGAGAAGPGNRGTGAAAGAAVAPAFAGLARLPFASAGRVYRSVAEPTEVAARREIGGALEKDLSSPEAAAAAIDAAEANAVPAMIADTGETARALASGATRESGPARTVARRALRERQKGMGDRVTGAIERDLGPVMEPDETPVNMMQGAKAQARPLYEEFYAQPPVSSEALDNLMKRPAAQDALKKARTMALNEGDDPEALGLHLDQNGNVVLEPGPQLSEAEVEQAFGGRYRPVEAPDPKDELGTRTVTTKRGRKVKVKGPLDITQSIRLMGGLKDKGGELAGMDLDKNPARRLPFGGHERMLGKIVNNETGMNLDDATHALWEEGYFPEFGPGERPTPDDLLTKLRNEQLGDRYFHPDDAEELARYEAANADVNYLGNLEEEGRPMAEDISAPAGGEAPQAPPGGQRPAMRTMTYKPKTIDYIKRAMDDVVEEAREPLTGKLKTDTARAIDKTREDFVAEADKLYPEHYPQARGAYSGPARAAAAFEDGKKALNWGAGKIRVRMRRMSDSEKEMFKAGHRAAMADLAERKGDSADVATMILGDRRKRKVLRELYGDQFKRFEATLNQEREGYQTFKGALGGSDTMIKKADDDLLKGMGNLFTILGHGKIDPLGAATTAVRALGLKMSEQRRAQMIRQLAGMLTDTSPEANRRTLQLIQKEAARRGIRLRNVRSATRAAGRAAVGTGAAAYQQGQTQQPQQ